jgi:hypothetical protein
MCCFTIRSPPGPDNAQGKLEKTNSYPLLLIFRDKFPKNVMGNGYVLCIPGCESEIRAIPCNSDGIPENVVLWTA